MIIEKRDKTAIYLRSAGLNVLVEPDFDTCSIDDIQPLSVVSITQKEELSTLFECAHELSLSVIIRGGGTRLHIGEPIKSEYILADLSEMNKIIEYDPAELLLVAEAGVTLGQIKELTEKDNLCLPLNPPDGEKATIGGTLASASTGFLREEYGAARDLTLGLNAIRANGDEVKFGGRVAKNVAGYDLTKLMIGSWGTLGCIYQAALRLKPLPNENLTGLIHIDSLEKVADFAKDLLESHYKASFLTILSASCADYFTILNKTDKPFLIIFGLAGIKESVQWQCAEIEKLANEHRLDKLKYDSNPDLTLLLENFHSVKRKGLILKASTTRSGVFKLLQELESIRSNQTNLDLQIAAQPGSGSTYVYCPHDTISVQEQVDLVKNLREFVEAVKGSLTIERAAPEVKGNVWSSPNGISIMKDIKSKLDPHNILNSGRYI